MQYNKLPQVRQSVVNSDQSEPRKEDYTWECVAGKEGNYEGYPFVYQGCGIMEPVVIPFSRRTGYCRRACACEREARATFERMKKEHDWRASQIKATFGWMGPRWADVTLAQKTFANFDARRQPTAFESVQMWLDILTGTLILHGPYGTGKTHLLASLCNALRERQKSSSFVTAPKLFNAIQERIGENQPYSSLIYQAIRTPLLVIDDIDKAKHSPFREEIYFEIIDERVKLGLPIAISTNRLSELTDFVGGACVSRFSIGQVAIEMTGEDYRTEL